MNMDCLGTWPELSLSLWTKKTQRILLWAKRNTKDNSEAVTILHARPNPAEACHSQ